MRPSGWHHSEETKQKIKAQVGWKHTESTKEKMRQKARGKVLTPQHKKNISLSLKKHIFKGKPQCKDCNTTISYISTYCRPCAGIRRRKENSTKDERHRDMERREYILWRKEIFTRDNYKCQVCGAKGYVEADHKVPWFLSENRRYDKTNGLTMCKSCHLIKTFVIDRKFSRKVI